MLWRTRRGGEGIDHTRFLQIDTSATGQLSALTVFLYASNRMTKITSHSVPFCGNLTSSLFHALTTAHRFRVGRLATATPRTDWPPN